MRSFEENRIEHTEIPAEIFEHPIPAAIVKPINETLDTCVFIFNTGMNGTVAGSLYMNNDFYNNHYFVCFDRLAHGTNKNKPSQYKSKYIKELFYIVDWVKQKLPNRKIYLLGESWGSAIALLFYKEYPKLVDGVVCWNMPTKPIDPEKKKGGHKAKIAFKQLAAYLFKIPTKLPPTQSNYGTLTRNPVLIRAKNVVAAYEQHSFITLACWRFMRPSKKFLFKHGKDGNLNFLYIQSGQDALAVKKNLPKYSKMMDSNHYLYMETGYHILSLEPVEADLLYKEISKFIAKK